MGEPLRIILLFIPLIAGAIAIFFSFQLMKRFGAPFVSSYFYYLVFLYIFGAYSLAGSGILEYLLARMEIEVKVIHSARLFTIFLGIPFISLSTFMLLKSMMEFFQKKIPTPFTIFYFAVSIIAFILYGFFVIRLTRFELGEYQLLISVQRWTFLGFVACMYLVIFMVGILYSRKMADHYEKRFIRVFGSWYLLFMVLNSTAFSLIYMHVIVSHIFIYIFLSWHLIPILFLNIYLERYHGQSSSLQDDFETMLTDFSKKFEISKREREVIQLICKGQTNQEIGDALFISLQTVKDHVHRIFLKTGAKNRVQLTNLIRSGT
ncbi:MAG: LuxR C-terminal-related transcriptional regulator [Bacteroidota bacterium]